MADLFDTVPLPAPQMAQGDLFDTVPIEKPLNFLEQMSRPVAAVRNVFQHSPAEIDQSLAEGWNNPRGVQKFADIFTQPTKDEASTPAQYAGVYLKTLGKGLAGEVLDMGLDPYNYAIPPGLNIAGKNLAQGLARASERNLPYLGKFAQWSGNQVRRINPSFAARVAPAEMIDASSRLAAPPLPSPAYGEGVPSAEGSFPFAVPEDLTPRPVPGTPGTPVRWGLAS